VFKLLKILFESIFIELHPKKVHNLPDRCRFNRLFDKKNDHLTPFLFLTTILEFSHHNFCFYSSLVFSENKTDVGMKKCFTIDFWEFFKYGTTEIRHLWLRRHFQLFQKQFFYDFFVFEGRTKR
jgi:hypothetical protein